MQIIVRGLSQLSTKMSVAAARIPKYLHDATLRAVLYVHQNMPPYPPPPPNSTYRRTGTLGRTVTTLMGSNPNALSRVENLFGSVRGIVGTRLYYAPYVIDKKNQSRTHRGRWWTLQDVVLKLKGGIRDVYAKEMRSFLKGIFK